MDDTIRTSIIFILIHAAPQKDKASLQTARCHARQLAGRNSWRRHSKLRAGCPRGPPRQSVKFTYMIMPSVLPCRRALHFAPVIRVSPRQYSGSLRSKDSTKITYAIVSFCPEGRLARDGRL